MVGLSLGDSEGLFSVENYFGLRTKDTGFLVERTP